MVDTLRNLWTRIPGKWKLWILSFIIGIIITLIWDVGTLLIILFLLFVLSYLVFNLFGGRRMREVSQWSITQFYQRIRGMLIFALLPALCELIKQPSLENIIGILLLFIIALTIWDKFNELIGDINKQFFGKLKRRR